MPCPNCNCAECAKDRAKDGWHGLYLYRDGIVVAGLVFLPSGWCWSGRLGYSMNGPYSNMEAAQQAAEAATLPAGGNHE